jgi:hypothetical protein
VGGSGGGRRGVDHHDASARWGVQMMRMQSESKINQRKQMKASRSNVKYLMLQNDYLMGRKTRKNKQIEREELKKVQENLHTEI